MFKVESYIDSVRIQNLPDNYLSWSKSSYLYGGIEISNSNEIILSKSSEILIVDLWEYFIIALKDLIIENKGYYEILFPEDWRRIDIEKMKNGMLLFQFRDTSNTHSIQDKGIILNSQIINQESFFRTILTEAISFFENLLRIDPSWENSVKKRYELAKKMLLIISNHKK